MKNYNRVMGADSYKFSHASQYPQNMVSMYDYMEARSSKVYPATVFVGLQGFLKEYFSEPITIQEVNQAYAFAKQHGISFDIDGWEYIVKELQGKLPVEIKAIEEGTLVPVGNVLMTIESTDTKVPWVAGWLETMIMRIWYPTNIATKSYYTRKMLECYAKETQDDPNVNFQLHNFGSRGCSSSESSQIAGFAHLTQFMGTDNFDSLKYCFDNYLSPIAGFSIPASEHSTVTSHKKENEYSFIENHYEQNKNFTMVACVMDSYNYSKAVEYVCKKGSDIQDKINSTEYPIFVIRPDSGVPEDVISETLNIMEKEEVPYTINGKGFKVFNKMRIIYGDGINMKSMILMLDVLVERGYSSENLNFGSGGWLNHGN